MAKKVILSYNSLNNTLMLPIKSEEIIPNYLYYALEFKKIPQDVTIIFNDMTVKLKKNGSKYEYERIDDYGK